MTAQDKYFYADGLRRPLVDQASDSSLGYNYTPRNITALRFNPTIWQNLPRPHSYHGSWPPTSASQLLDTRPLFDNQEDPKAKLFRKAHGKQIHHDCLGKYCWQHAVLPDGYSLCAEENCNHTFAEWLTGASGWEERLELRITSLMGSGLYSKRAWKDGDILGAYLGELIPNRTSNTEYCHEVVIGPAFEKTKAPIAYIDAELCGNYVRFCNHSCEHNAVISEGRVG